MQSDHVCSVYLVSRLKVTETDLTVEKALNDRMQKTIAEQALQVTNY